MVTQGHEAASCHGEVRNALSAAAEVMKVIIPYTPQRLVGGHLRGLTATTAAFGVSVDARLVDVSGSDFDYYGLMKALWAQQETFIIVEHDALPSSGTLPELWKCPESWCMPMGVSLVC